MRWIALAALLACALAAACTDWRAKVPPKYLPIAEIHHSVCGNCHKRVEPGQRTRAVFERALRRHHSRVKMTDAQWAELVDYLSQTP
jgi:hypothetical protein